MRLNGVADGFETFDEDISKAESALRSIGLEARKSSGEFRKPIDVLEELSEKMNSLSDVEISSVTEALAGKMRANTLKAILTNFDVVKKQLGEAEQSYGSSARENEKYMAGLEAKTKQLSATMTTLWQRSFDTATFKRIVDFTRGIVELIRALGGLPTILTAVGAAFVAMNLTSIITKLGSAMVVLGANLELTVWNIQQFGVASTAASVGASALSAALGALPIVLMAAAVAYGYFSNQQAEADIKSEALISKLIEEKNGILNLQSEYEKLIVSGEDTSKNKEQLKSIQAELIDSYKIEADSIDLVNGKYEKQISIIQNVIANKAKEIRLSLEGKKTKAESTLKDPYEFSMAAYNTDTLLKGAKNAGLEKTISETENGVFGRTLSGIKINTSNIEEGREAIVKYIEELTKMKKGYAEGSLSSKLLDDSISELSTELTNLSGKIDTSKNTMDRWKESFAIETFTNKFKKEILESSKLISQWATETDTSKKDKLQTSIVDLMVTMRGAASESKQFGEVWKSLVEQTFESFTTKVDENTTALRNNVSEYKSITEDAENYSKTVKELDTAYSDNIKNVTLIRTAQQELQKENKLTKETYSSLIEQYPVLAQYKEGDIALSNELSKLYGVEAESLHESFNNRLDYSTEYFNLYIKGNSELWSTISTFYSGDTESFKTTADIKNRINNELLKVMEGNWGKFYISTAKQADDMISKVISSGVYSGGVDTAALSELRKQRDILATIEKPLNTQFEGVDFNKLTAPKIDTGKTKKDTSPNRKETTVSQALIEKARYQDLANEITRVNNLIESNEAKQKLTKSDKDKISLLKQEIELYRTQQENIHNLAVEQRKERDEKINSLKKTYKATIKGEGDTAKIVNETALLNAKAAEVNAHAKDKDDAIYKKKQAEYKALSDTITRFHELQDSEISKSSKQWLDLSGNINEAISNIQSINLDIIKKDFEDFNSTISKTTDAISQNQREMGLLNENDFSGKVKLIQENYSLLSDSLTQTQTELDTLNKIVPENQEQADELKQEINDLTKALDDGKMTLKEYNKELRNTRLEYQKMKDARFEEDAAKAEDYVNQYQSTIIKGLEKEIEKINELKSISDKRYENENKRIDGIISKLQEKNDLLKKEKEANDRLKEIEDKRAKVEDVKKREKNKIYRAGKGFVYEVDAKKLADAQKELTDAEESYAEFENDKLLDDQIKELEGMKEFNEESQRIETERYDNKISALQTFIDTTNEKWEALTTSTIDSQDKLITSLSGLLQGTFDNSLSNLTTFITSYNDELGKLDFDKIALIAGISGKTFEQLLRPVGHSETITPPSGGSSNPIPTPSSISSNISRAISTIDVNNVAIPKLSENIVASIFNGSTSSVLPKIPIAMPKLQSAGGGGNSSNNENININKLEIKTNDASDMIKQLRQLIYRGGK